MISLGQKIKVIIAIDLYPIALIKAGEKGKVVFIHEAEIRIELDNIHHELDTWENEVTLSLDKSEQVPYFYRHCELVD